MRPILTAILALLTLPPTLAAEDLLQPANLFIGLERPIPVILSMRGRSEIPEAGFTLLLLDRDGQVIESAEGLQPGPIDLAELLPGIVDLEETARIQVIAEGMAIGTPLVIQPLLTPPLVRSVQDVRPDGESRYTRVIGFGDDLLDPEDAGDRQDLANQQADPDWDPGEPQAKTGFRLYNDRDVVMHTDHGDIRITLAPEHAPNTAWNFRQLVDGGFYEDTIFHRVVHFDRNGHRFVIQGGDPSGTGNGSAGYNLPMEPSDLPHDLGVISMARANHPDSAGSQFFICLSREGTARLDGQYIAFGWATAGAEAIARIADLEIEDVQSGRPVSPPRIMSVELVPSKPQQPGTRRQNSRISDWWEQPREENPGRRPR